MLILYIFSLSRRVIECHDFIHKNAEAHKAQATKLQAYIYLFVTFFLSIPNRPGQHAAGTGKPESGTAETRRSIAALEGLHAEVVSLPAAHSG